MEGNLKDKFAAFSERLKLGSGDLSRKVTERMTNVSGKMKELFQVSTQADKIVEEATAEDLEGPDWGRSLELCDLVNMEKVSGQDAVRAIKKRLVLKSTRIQYLALTLLETCVKNCEKMFSEVASEKVLDEMVKMVDDRQTPVENREKALKLIEAWGESTEELRYLPIFEETYKSLKSRGIRFPGRDEESLAPIFTPPQSVAISSTAGSGGFDGGFDEARDLPVNESPEKTKEVFDVARNSVELLNTVLTSSPQQEALQEELTLTLVQQCRTSQFNVQRIIERSGDADPVLFEALNVNDDLQRVLTKFEEMSKPTNGVEQQKPRAAEEEPPAFAHVQAVEEDDSHGGGGEEAAALVRNRGSKTPATATSSSHDEDAMADLDEMIFGNKSGEQRSQKPKKQDSNDLIMF